jgi:hypothetical protein
MSSNPGLPIGRFLLGFFATVALALVVLAVWLGITGLGVRSDLAELQTASTDAQQAASTNDWASLADNVSGARSHAVSAAETLNSVPWTWASGFPVVGETVVAAATLTSATSAILSASEGIETLAIEAMSGGTPKDAGSEATNSGSDRTASAGALPGSSFAATLQSLAPAAANLQDAVTAAQEWEQPVADLNMANILPSIRPQLLAAQAQVLEIVQPISAAADNLWGFNLTRHYPYAAQIAHHAMLDEGVKSDYVVSLDPRIVASLLQLTGPITISETTIDAETAERYFTHDIYIEHPDSTEKDAVTIAFLRKLFQKLQSAQFDLTQLWSALAKPVEQGRLLIWSKDSATQANLEQTPLSGALDSQAGPVVTAALNNSAGNKIDSYIDQTLTYTVTGQCDANTVQGRLDVTVSLDKLPPGLPTNYIASRADIPEPYEYGSSAMLVHLYGPIGAQLTRFQIDGRDANAMVGHEMAHPVWGTRVLLPAESSVRVSANFDQPAYPGQDLAAIPQPTVRDATVVVVDERDCATS